MDKNLFKFVNFLLTEQIALAAMFYFEQVLLLLFLFFSFQENCVGMVSTNNI